MNAVIKYQETTPPLVNLLLRGLPYVKTGRVEELHHAKELIKLLLNAPKTTKSVVLYRGVIPNDKINYTHDYFDKGIISTAKCAGVASLFAENGGHVLKLHVPSNTPVLYLDDYNPYSFEPEEVLLPPGSFTNRKIDEEYIQFDYTPSYDLDEMISKIE